ncbi:MAG: RNA polymerase sigma factor [Acidobacteriota bacterium]|jgi:RNA polymerase sigma-70 factor (ECF subfamily)
MHGSANDNSNADLCARCAAGDQAAFSEVYRRYGGTLYGTAWRILKSPQEAEEVVQEAFLALYHTAADDPPRSLGAWLRRVTSNRALDRLRKRSRRGEVELLDGVHEADAGAALEAPSPAPHQGPISSGGGVTLDLERAIDRLPERARMVFLLHDVEGFKHREVAELMGISDGSSKSQLFRARAMLRDWLQQEACR